MGHASERERRNFWAGLIGAAAGCLATLSILLLLLPESETVLVRLKMPIVRRAMNRLGLAGFGGNAEFDDSPQAVSPAIEDDHSEETSESGKREVQAPESVTYSDAPNGQVHSAENAAYSRSRYAPTTHSINSGNTANQPERAGTRGVSHSRDQTHETASTPSRPEESHNVGGARRRWNAEKLRTFSHLKSILEGRPWDGTRSRGARFPHSSKPAIRAQARPRRLEVRRFRKSAAHAPNLRRFPAPLRPPGLREMLGRGLLRPPRGTLLPPDIARLRALQSRPIPGGPAPSPPNPASLELLNPPDTAKERVPQGSKAPHPRGEHWDSVGSERYLHAGSAWAAHAGDRWIWMLHSKGHWWTAAPDGQALAWESGHWWWKTPDGWFMLHDGQPWAYRQFRELEAEGFVHPGSGTEVIYSSDGRRAALIDLDGDAAVVDLATGDVIGRWNENVGK